MGAHFIMFVIACVIYDARIQTNLWLSAKFLSTLEWKSFAEKDSYFQRQFLTISVVYRRLLNLVKEKEHKLKKCHFFVSWIQPSVVEL